MLITISNKLKKYFSKDSRGFNALMALDGEVYRALENRRTIRFELDGQSFFIKQHYGVGWREIFKNLFQLRLPVLSAENEWRANQLLKKINIATIEVLAYGKRGWNPAKRQSFILSEELLACQSLEDFCRDWRSAFDEKRHLIKQVAELIQKMHAAGLNHRDCYLCHLWRHEGSGELYLMDLHRAQIRSHVPQRWRVKDLAGLYFSSMDIGLTTRDVWRFLKYYFQLPLRELLREEKHLLIDVKRRALDLYRRENHS